MGDAIASGRCEKDRSLFSSCHYIRYRHVLGGGVHSSVICNDRRLLSLASNRQVGLPSTGSEKSEPR